MDNKVILDVVVDKHRRILALSVRISLQETAVSQMIHPVLIPFCICKSYRDTHHPVPQKTFYKYILCPHLLWAVNRMLAHAQNTKCTFPNQVYQFILFDFKVLKIHKAAYTYSNCQKCVTIAYKSIRSLFIQQFAQLQACQYRNNCHSYS